MSKNNTLKLSELELEVLLKILSFTNSTAKFLMDAEIKKGTPKGSDAMATLADDAQILHDLIVKQTIKQEDKPEFLN